MAKVYEHTYIPLSVYGNVIALLRDHPSPPGVHLDIGCGYGAIAEPIRDELGRSYLGFDLAEDGLSSLRTRGFEAHQIDLADPSRAENIIRGVVGGRLVGSLTLLDCLEHITNGVEVLAMLRRLAEGSQAPIVLSVPNVAHKDLGLKLLTGRWDVTEAGLLDYTHVAFYTHARLLRLMSSVGWRQSAARDWLLEHSDQEFPQTAPVLNHVLPVGHFLRRLIDQANPHSIVNQFVRLYQPDVPKEERLLEDRDEPVRPLLSILIPTGQARLPRIRLLLDGLSRQTNQDFQPIVVIHPSKRPSEKFAPSLLADLPRSFRERVRVFASDHQGLARALNAAVPEVRGRYVTVLGEGDLLEPHWCATFAEMLERAPGVVLQVGQTPPRDTETNPRMRAEPAVRALSEHVLPISLKHDASIADIAIPVGVLQDLGLRFDPEAGGGAAWDLAVQAIFMCGVQVSTRAAVAFGAVDGLSQESNRNPDSEHEQRGRLLAKLNAHPLLLPPGSAERVRQIETGVGALQEDNLRLHADTLTLREENARTHANAAALRDEFDRTAARVEALHEANAQIHGDMKTLREENIRLYSETGGLRAEHDRVSADAEALRAEHDRVSADAEALRAEHDRVSADAEALRAEHDRVSADAEALRAEHDRVSADAEALRAEHDRVSADAEALRAANEFANSRWLSFRKLGSQPLVRDFVGTYLPTLLADLAPAIGENPDGPFLSIITRTQGQRIRTLRDTILSLAGQSCQDFELLLAVHNDSVAAFDGVSAVADEFPAALRQRIRVIKCVRAGRAAPLNDAASLARGRYIAVLDDDDFVLGHWVETFKSLAAETPGAMLRAVCAAQNFEMYQTHNRGGIPRATSWFNMAWPGHHDQVAHLFDNHTPFMSMAFPAGIFRDLGLKFDEALSTTEDWDFANRVATVCGVRGAAEVTSIYRWWTNTESSSFLHTPEEWSANRHRIIDRLDSHPLLLPPGSVRRINKLTEDNHILAGDRAQLTNRVLELESEGVNLGARIQQLAHELAVASSERRSLTGQVEQLTGQAAQLTEDLAAAAADYRSLSQSNAQLAERYQWMGAEMVNQGTVLPFSDPTGRLAEVSRHLLVELVNTTSWRYTRPLRRVVHAVTGRPGTGIDLDHIPTTLEERQRLIHQLKASSSWRLTSPLRALVTLLRRSGPR